MAVEQKRGCGYRKIGGLYLVGATGGFSCDRLPFPLLACPTCGNGIKFSRGWTWIAPEALFEGKHKQCKCPPTCPICNPSKMGKRAGLLWVGEQFYTPKSFAEEAVSLGVSKRINAVPRGLRLGVTWVLFAHRKAAVIKNEHNLFKEEPGPGIFYAFIPQRVEKIVTMEDLKDEEKMKKLHQQKITPVGVPGDDPDHK